MAAEWTEWIAMFIIDDSQAMEPLEKSKEAITEVFHLEIKR